MKIIHQGNLAFVLSMITAGKSTGEILEEAESRGIKIEVQSSAHREYEPKLEPMQRLFVKEDLYRHLPLKQRHAPKGMQSPRKAKRKKP